SGPAKQFTLGCAETCHRRGARTPGLLFNPAEKMRGFVIQVKVRPRSRVSALEQGDDGTWVAHVKAPPVEGKANEELIALVADRFRCRKSAVSIQSGASGRVKLVRIASSP